METEHILYIPKSLQSNMSTAVTHILLTTRGRTGRYTSTRRSWRS